MILGSPPYDQAFLEIDRAVTALEASQAAARGRAPRVVVFNAQGVPSGQEAELLPEGCVVYNFENIGKQLPAETARRVFYHPHVAEVWDFSEENIAKYPGGGFGAMLAESFGRRELTPRILHVPVGYHPSMTSFAPRPWAERDIDVYFAGTLNLRREVMLESLEREGLKVEVPSARNAFGEWGEVRDRKMARSKCVLNMRFEDGYAFPVLRALHAAANGIAVFNEPPVAWPFQGGPYAGEGGRSARQIHGDLRTELALQPHPHVAEILGVTFQSILMRDREMTLPEPAS